MKNKLLALSFAALLLLGMHTVAPVQAEAVQSDEIELGETEVMLSPINGESNLLNDGDFEGGELADSSGSPYQWRGTQGASLFSGEGAFEGHSLKLTGGSGTASYPFAYQSVQLKSRAIYQLRMWVKKDSGSHFMTTKLEFWGIGADGTSGSMRGTNTFSIKTTDGWEEVLYNFRAPFNATSVQVMPRIESNSETAYFDNVELYMVASPEAVAIETDSIFYYPEDTVGEATVTVSERIQPRAEGGYAAFTLFDTDGETPLVPETELMPLDEKLSAAFSYDVGLLDEMKKEYRIRARVYDSDKNFLEEKTVPIYKFARPAFLGADGVYRNGNTTFTPVIAYDVPNTSEAYRACQKAGITVVQGGVGDLALADVYELKVLVTLYPDMKPAGHPDNADKTINTVKKVVEEDDERVFGWAIMDEPNRILTDPYEDLRESYRIIRELDDKRPVFLNEASPSHFAQSAKVCDLLGTDPYLPGTSVNGTTVAKMNTTHVYDAVQKARAASGGKKPVACILQAFKWYTYLPDADAERHMIYQALFAGASSHGYYKIRNASGSSLLYKLDDIWSGITTFGTKEQADAYAHFVRKEYKGFSHFKGQDVMYHGYIKDNKLYMILLNQSITNTVEIKLPLVSFDGSTSIGEYTANYIVGGSGTVSGSGVLSVSIPKHKAVVLAIKPKSGSLSAFSGAGFWDYVENIRQGGLCAESGKVQNGNLETLVNDFPTDITATDAALEVSEVHGGQYALHLTGSSTVSAKVSLEAGKCYDAAAYMKLTGGSIQLSVYNGSVLLGQTEAFSESPNGWQKMMVSLPPLKADAKITIQITHTGDGGANIDDIECFAAEGLIRNGDFEGKMNTHTPAGGWESTAGFGEAIQLLSENGEQFLKMDGGSGKIGISTDVSLTEGAFYQLKLDAKGEGAAIGMDGIMDCTRIGAAPEGAEFWVRDFAYYFKAPRTGEFTLTLYCNEGEEASFDAVSLESLTLGKTEISENSETVFVTFNLPYDGKAQSAKLFLGAYDADGRLLALSGQEGTTAYTPFSDANECTEKRTGEVPALLSASLPKQAEHAVYKVFVWEGLRPIMAHTEKIVP